MSYSPSRQSGFTLVEMSIVLIILALLVGGVLAGKSIIRSSELRTIISEQEEYRVAVQAFRERYHAFPGDMSDAVDVWGTLPGCPSASAAAGDKRTCNGNGTGMVDTTSERFRFWQHLANAGLIAGRYTGAAGGGGVDHHIIGVNCPASKIGSNGWRIRYINTPMGANGTWLNYPKEDALGFGRETSNTDLFDASLTASEAWGIDSKIDDSMPGTGLVWARSWQDCTTATTNIDNDAAEYAINNSGSKCSLFFFQIGQ